MTPTSIAGNFHLGFKKALFWLFTILILYAAGQQAPDEDPCVNWGEKGADQLGDAAARLDYSRDAYISGCHQQALVLFNELTSEWPGVEGSKTHLKALSFLGEVKYKLGDREGSLLTFQGILEREPNYQISVLDHDPEAVSLFELAKALHEKTPPQPVTPPAPIVPKTPPKLPVYGYLPFGVPQFRQKKPGLGALHVGLQSTAAVASIGLHIYMTRKWSAPFRDAEVKQANILRYGVQWPITLVFWGSYLASHLQARTHWKNMHASPPKVSVHLEGNPEFVVLSARFNML